MAPALVARINAEFAQAVASADMHQVYGNIGAAALTDKPDEFTAHINAEIARMVRAVKLSGATID
jgi:tripartite-type tricarboxylate transporter receptor subunit TctC